MKKGTRTMLVGMIAICLTLLFVDGRVQGATGDQYPVKPIEILATWPAGSSVDFMARLIADVGPKYLKQPMVVINKVGASGSIAAADVISSKPDGYKLLMGSNTFFATTIYTQKVPFNPDHLVPLACFFEYKQGLAVKSDSPWKTLQDMVEYARKNPNKVKISHAGLGTTAHLPLMIIFKDAEVIHIPTKSGIGEQIPGVLGGHFDAGILTYQPLKSFILSGKLKVLAFFSDHRYSDLPDVPSLLDLGYSDAAKIATFNGLFMHKDTPEEIKKVLIDTCKKIYDDPQFKKGLENFFEGPVFGGPDFLKKKTEETKEVCIPLLKKLGLYIEQ